MYNPPAEYFGHFSCPEALIMRTKRRFLARDFLPPVVLVLASIFTGCGGGSSSNNSGSTGSNGSGEFLYVTSQTSIFAFAIDSTTGHLSSSSSVSVPAPVFVPSMSDTVVDPSAKLLFYFDVSGNAIDIFSINGTNGGLTPDGSPVPVPTGPVGRGFGLGGLAIDPAGNFLFLADPFGSMAPNLYGLGAFAISGSSGSLTAVSGTPISGSDGPVGAVVDHSGKFVFTSDLFDDISVFALDSTTGSLSPVAGSPFPTSLYSDFFLATDPAGGFLYASAPLVSPTSPNPPIPVANTISGWSVDGTTGALAVLPGSPFSTGNLPGQIAIDPAGKFLYVPNGEDGTISAFTIDPASGALSPISGSPFSVLPSIPAAGPSIAIDPSGQFLYINTAEGVHELKIDSLTGALTWAGTQLSLPQHQIPRQMIAVKLP
jgi:6-phosphogluconolactonase